MADYYSLLARAVANLPKSSPPSTRRAIYDRARKALTNQLRSLKPQLPESDIAREERALDDAVARLEAEFEPALAELRAMPVAAAPAEASAPPPPPPPAPPPPAPRPAEAAPTLRVPTPARPTAPALPLKPPPLRAPTPAPAAAAPPANPPAPAPPRAPQPVLPAAAAFRGPLLGAAQPQPGAAAATLEPPLGVVARGDAAADAPSPPLGGAQIRYEPARPVLTESGPRQTPTWLWVAGAVAVGFAGSIAVVAFLMRPALQDLTVPPPVDTPAAAAAPNAEKSLRRVGQATPSDASSTDDGAAAPATPLASDTAAPAPATPAPSVAATSNPAQPTNDAAAGASPAQTQTPAAPNPAATVPIAGRAAMLVATVADAAKPVISVGTAVWTIIPAPPGQPQGVGVKSEIDIPDLKMHASMVLRKNFDSSLPASHTIDLHVTFDPGSPIKGIKDIALPLMRRDEPPASDALTGVRVKISDNYFLVGLNRAEADVARNVQALGERGWFDFPMQLDDDRIAKLTFEKGADGEKIIAQALAAWK